MSQSKRNQSEAFPKKDTSKLNNKKIKLNEKGDGSSSTILIYLKKDSVSKVRNLPDEWDYALINDNDLYPRETRRKILMAFSKPELINLLIPFLKKLSETDIFHKSRTYVMKQFRNFGNVREYGGWAAIPTPESMADDMTEQDLRKFIKEAYGKGGIVHFIQHAMELIKSHHYCLEKDLNNLLFPKET